MNSESISLNDNILKLFSICFLQFYGNYSTIKKFEDFYTNDLIVGFNNIGISIENHNQFKIFCFAFFQQISKCFNDFKYNENQILFEMYNPSILKEIDTDIDVEIKDLDLQEGQTNYSKKIMNIFKGYQNLITNKISNMKKQFLTPLISATERVVDMVLAVSNFSLNLFLL